MQTHSKQWHCMNMRNMTYHNFAPHTHVIACVQIQFFAHTMPY